MSSYLLSTTTAVVLLTCAAARGADFHVNQSHSGASDANAGSAEEPLSTIMGAVARLQAGDRIVVHEGVYREQVELKGTGDSWATATALLAVPGEDVVIKGSDVVTGWELHEGEIWKKTDWETNSQIVFADGERLTQIAGTMIEPLIIEDRWQGRIGDGIEDMIPGSFYYDLDAQVLYVWLEGGADPNQVLMEATVRPFLFVGSGAYYIVRGFRMMHSNTSDYINWSAVRMTGRFGVFQDNAVSWCDYVGLTVIGSYIDILDSSFNYCGNSGLGGGSKTGVRLIGNETSYNNWRKWSMYWHAGGAKFTGEVRDLVIENHTALHNVGPGIWIDTYDTSNVTIERSEAAYNLRSGIQFEISRRGVIANNLLHHNSGRGIYVSHSENSLLAHNTCYGNGMSGIVVMGENREGPVERFGSSGIIPAGNNRVIGNILAENLNPQLRPEAWHPFRPELILPDPTIYPDRYGGCYSDYNVFYRANRDIPFWYGWGWKIWYSLGTWQAGTGNDAHSVIASPRFLDPENGDFRVEEGSPADNLALVLGEVGDDFEGVARPTKGEEAYRTAGAFELQPAN